MKTLLPMLVMVVLAKCPSSEINENLILGKWMMVSVYDGVLDVTTKHNPKGNRWIEFRSDYKFESGGEPYGPNSGKWSVDAEKQLLFLDSDAGEEDDSFWIISIKEDQMVWNGSNAAFAERFRLVHRRAAKP